MANNMIRVKYKIILQLNELVLDAVVANSSNNNGHQTVNNAFHHHLLYDKSVTITGLYL